MTRKCLACDLPHHAKNLCIKHYAEAHYAFGRKRKRLRQHQGRELDRLLSLPYDYGRTVVRAVWQAVREALERKEEVEIKGLGRFFINEKGKADFTVAKDIEKELNRCI